MSETLTTIRRRYAAKIAHMRPVQARILLDKIQAEGVTVDHPTIRELTGGYCTQSLNHAVVLKLSKRANQVRDLTRFRIILPRVTQTEPRDPPGWEAGFADNH